MKISPKRTKIVCTIGPASSSKSVIKKMARAGLNTARLNFSHGNLAEHAQFIHLIRDVAKELDNAIGIIADLQGPRVRVGAIGGSLMLKKNDVVILYDEKLRHQDVEKEGKNCLPITYGNLYRDVKHDDTVLIDSGKVELRVQKVAKQKVYCRVISGGKVSSHKGLNVPTTAISLPAVTKQDEQHLEFAVKEGCDFIAVSFVRSEEDINYVRRLIKKFEKRYHKNGAPMQIIAKIERHEALKNIDKIITASDGIMVARGDLGLETPLSRVPLIQKEIVQKCSQNFKPVIIATQMLSSMVESPQPTRSEISDVANAVIDHTHAVMLSEETAVGQYPVQAVKIMADVIVKTEESIYDDFILPTNERTDGSVDLAISSVAGTLAKSVHAKAILVVTLSGKTARLVAKFRPEFPVIVTVENPKVQNQLSMVWGVTPLLMKRCHSLDELINQTIAVVRRKHLIKIGDQVILIAGQPVGESGNTNWIKVHKI